MEFFSLPFDALTLRQLHDMFVLRAKVFVVEQQCVYADPDGKDPGATHVFGYSEGRLTAYCRILPPGLGYGQPSIGRVVVAAEKRGKGWGKKLMEFAIRETGRLYPGSDIVISAQQYLVHFYGSLDFQSEGAGYLEDDIPHQQMRRIFKVSS